MRFSESDAGDAYLVEGYGPEGIRVAGRTLPGGLVLAPGRLIEGWGPERPEGLEASHLQVAIDLAPELILLGTGAALIFPESAVLARVRALGIGLEIMDTGAACRTYNVLVSERRRVAAALLPL